MTRRTLNQNMVLETPSATISTENTTHFSGRKQTSTWNDKVPQTMHKSFTDNNTVYWIALQPQSAILFSLWRFHYHIIVNCNILDLEVDKYTDVLFALFSGYPLALLHKLPVLYSAPAAVKHLLFCLEGCAICYYNFGKICGMLLSHLLYSPF